MYTDFSDVVQQIGVKYARNCGFWVKDTKFGTQIEQNMLNQICYGPLSSFRYLSFFRGFISQTVLNLPSQLSDFINKNLFQVRAERKEFLKTYIQ